MPRRTPYIHGRGNVAPPAGYRPGLKARWLKPRPTYPHVEPDTMPFQLVSVQFTPSTPGLLDPGDAGLLIATIPAGSYIEAAPILNQQTDQPGQFLLWLCADASTTQQIIGIWTGVATGVPGEVQGAPELQQDNPPDISKDAIHQPALCTTSKQLYAAFFSAGTPPTNLEGVVIAKIYS